MEANAELYGIQGLSQAALVNSGEIHVLTHADGHRVGKSVVFQNTVTGVHAHQPVALHFAAGKGYWRFEFSEQMAIDLLIADRQLFVAGDLEIKHLQKREISSGFEMRERTQSGVRMPYFPVHQGA